MQLASRRGLILPRLAAFASDDAASQQLMDFKQKLNKIYDSQQLNDFRQKLNKTVDSQSNEIPMAEYMQFLRNRNVLDNNPVIITTILVQFFKRLLRNEGLEGEHDDIFRHIYSAQRAKVNSQVINKQEIIDAI